MVDKNNSNRDEIAHSITRLRQQEYSNEEMKQAIEDEQDPEIKQKLEEELKKIRYEVGRDGKDYLIALRGLSNFFEYVRSLGVPVVYDVGAGETKAAAEIQESSLASGIEINATVLANIEAIKKWLGPDKVVITPAETMRGIKDQ